MKVRALSVLSLAVAIAFVAAASACSSLETPGNATTQALNDASVVSGAMASTVAAAAPTPWGQIVAAVLGAISVIAGIIAHSTAAKNTAEQMADAVTTGLQAAAQSLGANGGTPSSGVAATSGK